MLPQPDVGLRNLCRNELTFDLSLACACHLAVAPDHRAALPSRCYEFTISADHAPFQSALQKCTRDRPPAPIRRLSPVLSSFRVPSRYYPLQPFSTLPIVIITATSPQPRPAASVPHNHHHISPPPLLFNTSSKHGACCRSQHAF